MSIQKLGRYDLNRVIGKGAMGLVYEGRDPNLDRRVAIKTILIENLTAEAIADYEVRFKTEAKSAARLQHPNIVSVYDSDRDGNTAFLVMEFIQGEDLKHHLDRGVRFQLDQSIAIVRDLLSALDYAHRQNVIHRDVKPANLLLEASGRVKLTDFGVARIQDSNEATRTQGSIVGTLKYMAPEQVQGHAIDARTDLFAAGVVLYQLLTGRRPFDDENDFAIMHQIIGKDPELPSSINPLLPKTLDGVLAKALAKSRDDRFATARDFALALQSACRRATDTTVVPPVGTTSQSGTSQPGVGAQRTGTGTGTSVNSSTSGTSPSTVTQEIELVYWKDVKDSTDVDDLQGFLARFPTGIYADLAQRRVRKLTGMGSDGTLSGAQTNAFDTTQTSLAPGAVRLVGEDGNSGTYTSTQVTPSGTDSSSSSDTDVDFDPLATVKMMSDDEDATMHLVPQPLADETQDTVAQVAKSASGPTESDATTETAKAVPPGADAAAALATPPLESKPKSPALMVGIALAVVLLAGLGIKTLWPSSAKTGTEAGSSADASAVPPLPDTKPPVQPAVGAMPSSLPAVSAPSILSAASAPASSASKITSKTIATDKARHAETAGKAIKAASAPENKSDTSAHNPSPVPSPPAQKQNETPTKSAAMPVQQPTLSPKAACEGKVLLSYHSCMLEQCARPGHQNDPACIERLEIEQRSRNRQF